MTEVSATYGEKSMALHKLTLEEKVRGIRKNIRVLSRKRGGPKWLLPSMRVYLKKLQEQIKRKHRVKA